MRKNSVVFLITLVLFSCSGADNADGNNDSDMITDTDMTELPESTIDDGIEHTDSDIPDELPDMPAPVPGITLSLRGTVHSTASDSELPEDKQLEQLHAEVRLTDKSLSLDNKAYSEVYSYGDYLVVSLLSEMYSTNYYMLQATISKQTLRYLKKEKEDTVTGHDIPFTGPIYEANYADHSTMTTCPVAVTVFVEENVMRVDTDDTAWEKDDPVALSAGLSMSEDRDDIMSIMGGNEFYELCQCYFVEDGEYVQGECTRTDVYDPPTPPETIAPKNHGTVDAGTVTLSFDPAVDPEGFDITYKIFTGTSPMELTEQVSDTTETSHEIPCDPDTDYFWKVTAESESGHVVESPVSGFTTREVTEFSDLLIIGKNELLDTLTDEIATYRSDLESQGYSSSIYTIDENTTAEDIRNKFRDEYTEHFISAALLLGSVPAGWYELDNNITLADGTEYLLKEHFPTDIYYMDLDAVWTDKITNGTQSNPSTSEEPNGRFEAHSPIRTEIVTARIPGTAAMISTYLDRVHIYRENGDLLDPSLLLYVDDDWSTYQSDSEKWSLDPLYDEHTAVFNTDDTTRTRYLEEIAAGHAFVFQWIHSDPHTLYFNENFGYDTIAIDELESADVTASFFNLFDCSASRFNDPEYYRDEKSESLAIMYLHSNYGLATVGSSKTGGMLNPALFHGSIAAGKTWGEGFRLWYDTIGITDDLWWLGMTIFGDPMLTLTDSIARSVTTPGAIRHITPMERHEMRKNMILRVIERTQKR